MSNTFNLIDEPWIPVVDIGLVSLRGVFEAPTYRSLGGNPIQRIALTKLLLGIAQAASTPKNKDDWMALGVDGLAKKCLDYLAKFHDRFDLYGEHPFLQMPAISKAKLQDYGAVVPEISTGNTTVLNQGQVGRLLDDGEKALLLVTLMSFALGGKKTDNSVTLTSGYVGKQNEKGKPSTSKPGPAVAHMGLLHSFLIGSNLQETIWLNLFTEDQLSEAKIFAKGIGVPPWERMPRGEDCEVAKDLKQSLMGRLVPMCRFCLLKEDGLHYSEGLAHSNYKEGIADPTAAVDHSGKDPKALWANPEKRPWRELTSLLSFIAQGNAKGFESLQLRLGLNRARDVLDKFSIWSGGLKVSSNAGEQYVSGNDDFVESQVALYSTMLGEAWFIQLTLEMEKLDRLRKILYGRVISYFKDLKAEGESLAVLATTQFLQLCERHFQMLVEACDQTDAGRIARYEMRKVFAQYLQLAYNHYCPKETARQLDAWAKNKPNINDYLCQNS